jgi:hypothetical protein
MDPNSKRYATVNHPTVNAIVHKLYRLPSEAAARERLELIRSHFVISARQLHNDAHPSVHLWIKGFDVTPEQKAKGVIGNFAVISYQKSEEPSGVKWILSATKLETPADVHPQRAQVKRDNPNWGHPVLRSIRKGKHYKTLEEAQSELNLLHEHFPKVSIPNLGKLFIMIYCSNKPPKERMVKHVLKIQLQPDATYIIECKENIKPKVKKAPVKAPPKTPGMLKEVAAEPAGYFTAKVALGRHVKGKKAKPTAADAKTGNQA